jgi:Phage integrase family
MWDPEGVAGGNAWPGRSNDLRLTSPPIPTLLASGPVYEKNPVGMALENGTKSGVPRAGLCGDLTFIVGADGKPLTKESFGNAFREACRAAGVPGSAHGVRKIAATTAANNGATTSQLKALFGWTSDAMPTLYTRAADRHRLGREAGHMLENANRTSIPSPKRKVRAPERKGQR